MDNKQTNTEIQQLHSVWEHEMKAVQETELPAKFDEIVSSIFTAGPSYFYVIDFFDMSVSRMSRGIKNIHGLEPETVMFNDILGLIHPDDLDFVAKMELYILDMIRYKFPDKVLSYKAAYCFRMKTADGSYKLFLHQGLQLTLDDNGGIAKALNIHTDISHITKVNNYKLSIISINGEPSYMDIDIYSPTEKNTVFTKRETEILKLLAEGLTTNQIAHKLHLSFDTVKTHRRNMLAKSGLQTTTQLVKDSVLKGLI